MSEHAAVKMEAITVPRTARYATLGGSGGVDLEEIWLVCHGYAQLASRFIRRFEVIAGPKRLIVAPEALSRFYIADPTVPHPVHDKVGASWMTREGRDAEIGDQVRYLDLVVEQVLESLVRPPARFVALGFSQGAAVICRWSAQAARPPDRVILWGSGVPTELLDEAGMQGLARSALTLVVGDQDPIAHGEHVAAHRAHLARAGVSYRFVGYAGGHAVNPDVLEGIANEA